jgi:hypothetical protein
MMVFMAPFYRGRAVVYLTRRSAKLELAECTLGWSRIRQQIIPIAGNREALGHLRQGLHVVLEVLPRPHRVLVHAHRQHDVDLEAQQPRIQQRDLSLDQACLFEFPDAPPDRTAGQPRTVGEIDLAYAQIFLQGAQQLVIGTGQLVHGRCLTL